MVACTVTATLADQASICRTLHMQSDTFVYRMLTVDALREGHRRLQVLAPEAVGPVDAAWARVCANAVDLAYPASFADAGRSEKTPAAAAQSEVSAFLDDERGAALLELVKDGRDELEGLQHQARVRSCAGGPSSAWLDALPSFRSLAMSDQVFTAAGRFRLGLSLLPDAYEGATCACGKALTPTHMMGCKLLNERIRLRHDILVGVWKRIFQRAGVAASIEPLLRHILNPDREGQEPLTKPDSRGDLIAVLAALTTLDVSVAHPACAGTCSSSLSALRRAAMCAGSAARTREKDKDKQYRDRGFKDEFIPLAHESYGRLGPEATEVLNALGEMVAQGGRSTKAAFIRSAHQELAVALQRGNYEIFRMHCFNCAKLAGRHFVAGDAVPSALLG